MEYIVLSIPLFFVLIGAELLWSWRSGKQVYRLKDFVSNLGCGIGSQVVGAFTKTFIFAAYLWTYDHWRLFTLENTVLTGLTAFLLIDVSYYWFHRLSHKVGFLWAAHVVHHQSEEYNLGVALRQSWFQGLFSWWFYLPVAVMGIHPIMILTVGAFVTLYQFWIHTKALGKLGPLEVVLNTPSHHRVHHGSDPKYIDRNHAGTLIVWDKIFGTFQREEEEPVYGITSTLTTWDPVSANLRTWMDMVELAKRCPRWQDKARVFLGPPGWQPAELGGPQRAVQRDRTSYQKFDTQVPRAVARYVLAQFWVLVGLTALFLFRQEVLEPMYEWSMAGLIVLWVMGLGLLLDGKRWGLWSEAVRILFLAVLVFFGRDDLPGTAWTAGAELVCLVSGVWLWRMGRSLNAGGDGYLGAAPYPVTPT